MNKKRYFFDMDGVLAKYEFNLPSFDTLYEQGYFLNRPMQENIVEAAATMLSDGDDVFILSAVLMDSLYAFEEKHKWLDNVLPIECRRRIFTICGEDKIGFIPGFDKDRDVLIDDFGGNTRVWANAGGKYVKVSVDAEDAEYERTKHDFVIHPEMPAYKIVDIIRRV